MKKMVYKKFLVLDQIYNFVVEKIFIWDRYSHQMGHVRYFKAMLKEKYLISSHMWWCSRDGREGSHEAGGWGFESPKRRT